MGLTVTLNIRKLSFVISDACKIVVFAVRLVMYADIDTNIVICIRNLGLNTVLQCKGMTHIEGVYGNHANASWERMQFLAMELAY